MSTGPIVWVSAGWTTTRASPSSNQLVERIVNPDFVYAHEWEQGDLVIWDNRALLHAATPYDMEGDRRLIYRTTTKGERPIPANAHLQSGAVA